jgi:hypothetical protein
MDKSNKLKIWDHFLHKNTLEEFEINILPIANTLLMGGADPNLIEDFYYNPEYPGLIREIILYLNNVKGTDEIKEPDT